MKTFTSQSGFIALISILILSAVLLATTLGLAQFGIANRFFILNLEQKSASEKLTEACVHIARIETYNDPLSEKTTPRSMPIGEEECTIVSINPDGSDTMIKTRALSGDAISNLCVKVDNTNGDFLSWEEVSAFSNDTSVCP